MTDYVKGCMMQYLATLVCIDNLCISQQVCYADFVVKTAALLQKMPRVASSVNS